MTPRPRYRAWEDDLIAALYPDVDRLLSMLPHRSRNAIGRRAIHLGVTDSHEEWTLAEDNILRSSHHNRRRVAEMLPGRTPSAIEHRCFALGLALNRRFEWTEARMALFEKVAGKVCDREAAAMLGTNTRSVANRRYKLKVPPFRLPHKKPVTRIRILEDIKREASSRGQSLRGLTGGKPLVAFGRLSAEAVATAVAVLGGKLFIEWDD